MSLPKAFPKFPAVVALLLLMLPLAGIAQFNGPASVMSPQTPVTPVATTDQSLLYPTTRDLKLTPGDVVAIKLFGEGDYAPTVRIANDGTVMLPLIGVLPLADLTVTQAEQLIASKLQSAGMYNNPQVTLQITEGPNSVVTVVGEAHGVVPVAGSRRLFDVLSTAGGLPPTASHVITINRPGVPEPIVVDLGSDPLHSGLANVPVFPGDTIVVSRIGVVYVVGAFKSSGTIPLNQYGPLTLTEAASLSGGPDPTAKLNNLHLIRTEGNHRTVVKLDMKKVLYGEAPDPILQPNDILFLPTSTFKASLQNGSLGYILGFAGLLVSVAYR